MGWWWSSKPTGSSPLASETVPDIETAFPSIHSHRDEPSTPTNSATQTLSREEQANQDLMEMLKEFQAEENVSRDSRIKSRISGGILSQTTNNSLPTDISPDSLYPTEIHCRSAFDYALFCQSFGGQFVNIYRYGSFRSCSNHWDDFWLCMRTRNWDEKDRAKAVRDHYYKKSVKYKTGPSSEDIWEVRRDPVKDAFQDNLEELEERIAAWKKANPEVADPWEKQSGVTFNNPKPA